MIYQTQLFVAKTWPVYFQVSVYLPSISTLLIMLRGHFRLWFDEWLYYILIGNLKIKRTLLFYVHTCSAKSIKVWLSSFLTFLNADSCRFFSFSDVWVTYSFFVAEPASKIFLWFHLGNHHFFHFPFFIRTLERMSTILNVKLINISKPS